MKISKPFLPDQSSEARDEIMKCSIISNPKMHKTVSKPHISVAIAAVMALTGSFSALAEIGITSNKIVIGGVMDLEGHSRGLGQGMRDGIMAALDGKQVKGRRV